MESLAYFIVVGTGLGLSAGFAPGPLTALVIAQTLRRGAAAGIKVAVAPLITDLPIILICFFILDQVRDSSSLLALISFGGAVYIGRMGLENLLLKGIDLRVHDGEESSLRRGIAVNFLSPHPYIFWIGVGLPLLEGALRQGTAAMVFFLASFYGLLVGVKVTLALVTAVSKTYLLGPRYLLILRALGGLLLVLAGILLAEGLDLLLN